MEAAQTEELNRLQNEVSAGTRRLPSAFRTSSVPSSVLLLLFFLGCQPFNRWFGLAILLLVRTSPIPPSKALKQQLTGVLSFLLASALYFFFLAGESSASCVFSYDLFAWLP